MALGRYSKILCQSYRRSSGLLRPHGSLAMTEVLDRRSELERRLQVELLWTRRMVFAEPITSIDI